MLTISSETPHSFDGEKTFSSRTPWISSLPSSFPLLYSEQEAMNASEGELPMVKSAFRPWRVMLPSLLFSALSVGAWALGGFRVDPFSPFAWMGVLLLWILRDLWSLRQLKQEERRRQAAAAPASSGTLATVQPPPNATALPLPATITLRPGWAATLVASLLLLPFVAATIAFFPILIWSTAPLLPTLGVSLLLGVPVLTLLWLSMDQRIEVSEAGLTLVSWSGRERIPWQEVRLFAIAPGIKPTKPPSRFELASPTVMVRWDQAIREGRPLLFQRLFGPSQEAVYQRELLLSLIAGRTGLPLYDLRQPTGHMTPDPRPLEGARS